MFPQQGGGNRYPQEAGRLEQIPLPGAKFRITPPFGTDTYILLSTSTELSNPEALSFESVVRGGERGVSSPLEMLLGSTSAGTRGATAEVPTDWGVEYLQLHSQPKKGGCRFRKQALSECITAIALGRRDYRFTNFKFVSP